MAPTHADREISALLARTGRRRRFEAGELIQQRGDSGRGFWLVESGEVMICRFGTQGELTVYGVLGEGDLFGELAHFSEIPRQVEVVAETDAVLGRFDPPLIDQLLESEPGFARWLLKSLANQLRAALNRIDGDGQLSAELRIIRRLVDMANRNGRELRLTQQALGELIGISRITVGQVLRKLEKRGLVCLEYRRIVVPDILALARMAE